MNTKLMRGVWQVKGITDKQRLLLLALAGAASEAGCCCVSVGKLAAFVGTSGRYARRCLRGLRERGLLSVRPRRAEDGAQLCNMWRLHL